MCPFDFLDKSLSLVVSHYILTVAVFIQISELYPKVLFP